MGSWYSFNDIIIEFCTDPHWLMDWAESFDMSLCLHSDNKVILSIIHTSVWIIIRTSVYMIIHTDVWMIIHTSVYMIINTSVWIIIHTYVYMINHTSVWIIIHRCIYDYSYICTNNYSYICIYDYSYICMNNYSYICIYDYSYICMNNYSYRCMNDLSHRCMNDHSYRCMNNWENEINDFVLSYFCLTSLCLGTFDITVHVLDLGINDIISRISNGDLPHSPSGDISGTITEQHRMC